MKKKGLIMICAVALFALTVLPTLALTGSELGLDYGTYTGLGTKDLKEGVMTIVKYLFGFLGIIAILLMLYAGFIWMTAAGNEEKVSQAKKILTAAIIGLVIIFISYAIAAFVVNQLITATGATY
jgi:Zn-dependent protease with chaperone function